MNLDMFLSFFPPFFSTYLERKEEAHTTFPRSSINLLRSPFDRLLTNFKIVQRILLFVENPAKQIKAQKGNHDL